MKRILIVLAMLIGSYSISNCQSSSNNNVYLATKFLGWDITGPFDLEIRTNNAIRMIVSGTSSNIGIGVAPSATFMLDVAGSTNSTLYGIGGNTVLHNPGTRNMFTGVGSGASLSSGLDNLFNGFNAGNANSTGNNNVFIGSQAGLGNTSGINNLFCGRAAGVSNFNGNFNVYLGSNAGQLNVNGDSNVVIGDRAGSTYTRDATVLIGFNSGISNTAVGQTFVGHQTGWQTTTGGYNSFLGFECGFATTTGDSNVFVGYTSGRSNSTGKLNTYVGTQSGLLNTTSNGNTAFGYQSGRANTAANNTFIGMQSGLTNTTATGLTFVGNRSGAANTTGANNTFLGMLAGVTNTSGQQNTFVGSGAGSSNLLNNNSTCIGFQSGTVATGGSNTIVGSNAGLRNTIGNQNTFVGQGSGNQITTGVNNSYFGYQTGPSSSINSALSNSAAIGANAEVLNNNHMILGDNAVSVGIGLSGDPTGPTAKLDVRQPAVIVAPTVSGINAIVNGANTENRAGTFFASSAATNKGIKATSSGAASFNVAGEFTAVAATFNIGIDATGHFGTTGIGGRFTSTGSTGSNTGVSGLANSPFSSNNYGGSFTASSTAVNNYGLWSVASGATTINYGIYASNIISGTSCSAPGCADAAGYFSGPICVTDLSYVPSDLNLKTNVNDLINANTILAQLQPKTYYYDSVKYSMNLAKGLQFGLIAQELELVLPQFTRQFVQPETKDSLGNIINPQVNFTGISYEPLISLLIAGYKEQQLQIDSLINAIAAGNQPKMANPSAIEVTLSNQNKIILNQNDPNPFAENTTINYFIPDNVNDAQLLFYDNSGTILKTVAIKEKGQGSILIYGSNLSSGVYTYTLLADGKVMETKRMVKVK
jgi:hypothetical protein